jgi:CHAT domain-containing protein
LAFAEPGVEAVEKARWLLRIAKEQNMTKSKHQWLETERRQLSSGPSSAQLRYRLMCLQQQNARDSGDLELVHTIGLSRAELAGREHWAWEESESYIYLQVWCPKIGDGAEGYWKQAWAVAQREKSDELRLLALKDAPTPELFNSGVSQLNKQLGDDAKRELLLKSRVRSLMNEELVIREWTRESDYRRRIGDLPREISTRVSLGYALGYVGRAGQAIKELQAAYDLSLQLPANRTGWSHPESRPLACATMLAQWLGRSNYLNQQSAVLEGLLKTGLPLSPEDEFRIRISRLYEAWSLGDDRTLVAEWTALSRLQDSLAETKQTRILCTLHNLLPSQFQSRRGELFKRAKEACERDLREAWTPSQKSEAASALISLMRTAGDRAGLRLLLKQLLDSATSESEKVGLVSSLKQEYRRADLVDEFKQLSISQMANGDPDTRRDELSGCRWLAEKKDPLALAWAEELVRLSSSLSSNQKNYALATRAEVLYQFGRYQEALSSLDGLDLSKRDVRAREYPALRSKLLAAMNRKPEAIEVLKTEFARQLKSEEPQQIAYHFGQLLVLEQELGLNWLGELEELCQRYQSMGESCEIARSEVVYEGLELLLKQKQWDKGRELLTKYRWTLGAAHHKTKKLREYEQWKDLLPAEEKAASEPGQVGASPKEATTVRELVDQLRLNQPQLGELLSLRSTNLKYLQERLGPKETLVTYCSDGDQFYTIALRNKTSFFKRSQVSSRDLESLREKYLKALNSDKPSDSEASLFSTLLEPVLTEDSSQRILVVPTGTLWQLPFGALRDPKGRAAASRSDIVLLTSGDLLRLADNSWSPYRLSQPLAIGAPLAAELPGAFRELGEVAGALPNCELRRGDQATMASLYDSSRHWGLVHFASHAHYHQDRPLESDIQLHDGGLKIRQLSQLSLAEHALVTLSVCQGGDSAGQRLSEPVSLATGFSASGAETVVANLWPVEDEVARIFFGEFYKQLGRGDSPMKSFRQAQDKVRAKFPKPEDWAGFFLMGNPT